MTNEWPGWDCHLGLSLKLLPLATPCLRGDGAASEMSRFALLLRTDWGGVQGGPFGVVKGTDISSWIPSGGHGLEVSLRGGSFVGKLQREQCRSGLVFE